jgi:hypothetical protein
MNTSPFDSIETPLPAEPQAIQSGALEAQERAQIDMQIATAKRYPRSVVKVKAEIIALATMDEETASSCFYTLKRGDKVIQGPSIRLAEIALSSWGNIRAGTRIASTVVDGPMPHVVVQSVAHDLEKNTCITMEKRRRVFKKKSKPAPDEDDVNLAANACASIALRDAIIRVVPKTIINSACAEAKRVAIGDAKSLVAKRQAVVARLKQMGVSEDRILAAVGCTKVDEIDGDGMAALIGFGTAIRDGEVTIEEAFPPKPAAPGKPAFPPGPGATEPPDDVPMDSPRTKAPSAPAAATTAPPPAEAKRVNTLPAAPSPANPTHGDAVDVGPVASQEPAPPATDSGQGPVLSAAHQELDAFLGANGIAFAALAAWAVSTDWEPGWDSYASLDDVPAKSIARLLKSKAGLLKQLKAQTPAAAPAP